MITFQKLRQSWQQAASTTGATICIEKLPQGYDTLLQNTVTTTHPQQVCVRMP
jgi:ABC-type multidrug transport system fused ATPase/permease subunit